MKKKTQDRLGAGVALLGLLLAPLPTLAQGDTAATVGSSYILSPDDQLDISVLGHEDLKEAVTVLPDGTFHYPVVGSVHAAGLTVDGLTSALRRGLSNVYNQPQVNVTVTQSRPRKVSVLGAVKAPGQYAVTLGTHLLDVLAACGGPAQVPELTQATLVTDGGRQSLPVDMVALMNGGDPSLNVPLSPGDVVLVQARDASVAQVQVVGEVTKPGAFTVPTDGAPMLSVLAQAGGATPKAALTRAQLVHGGRTQVVDLHRLMDNASAPAGAFRLVAGDVLLVPANTAKIAVMGEVKSPAIYPIADGETLSVTSALAQAGGATDAGDKKNVDILRHGADGKTQIVAVNTEALMNGKNATGDVALQPGDVLYVPTRHKAQGGADVLQALTPLGWLSSILGLHL